MKVRWSPDTPLWFNPNLSDFQSLPDSGLWAAKGIKYLAGIHDGSAFFTFDRLKKTTTTP